MTDFYKELVAKLTNPKKQKPYKENSVKPVYGYLKKLNGGEDPTSLDYLLDRPMVLPFLQKYAVNTQRTIVFAIRNIAKDFNRDDILEVWKNNIEETEAGKGLPEKGEKSEAQEKAYALLEGDKKGSAWDSVLKRVEKYAVGHRDNAYLISQLFTKFPPRRNLDYSLMKLADEYTPEMSKEFNYLVAELRTHTLPLEPHESVDVVYQGKKYIIELIDDSVYETSPDGIDIKVGRVGLLKFADLKSPTRRKTMTNEFKFVFNRYKTDGVYHQKVFDVPKDLRDILKEFIKENDIKSGDLLLTKRTRGPLKSDDITDALHKVIAPGVSSQMLRHMYLDKYNTPEREAVIKDMMGDAEIMGHSISTQQNVYVKK